MRSGSRFALFADMTFKHILVPTDFGEPAQHALELAITLAQKFDCDLTLLHAVWIAMPVYPVATGVAFPTQQWSDAGRQTLETAVEQLKKRHPRSEGVLTSSDPAEAIVETAKKRGADLIVMGTHGRHGLSRIFLGSVAEKTVRMSPIPVLTVPGRAEQKA